MLFPSKIRPIKKEKSEQLKEWKYYAPLDRYFACVGDDWLVTKSLFVLVAGCWPNLSTSAIFENMKSKCRYISGGDKMNGL